MIHIITKLNVHISKVRNHKELKIWQKFQFWRRNKTKSNLLEPLELTTSWLRQPVAGASVELRWREPPCLSVRPKSPKSMSQLSAKKYSFFIREQKFKLDSLIIYTNGRITKPEALRRVDQMIENLDGASRNKAESKRRGEALRELWPIVLPSSTSWFSLIPGDANF